MNEIIQGAEDIIKIITKLSPDLMCIIGLIIIGYGIRAIPAFPNKFIPIIWLCGGPLIYISLVKPNMEEIPNTIRNIWVYQGLRGLILGAAAWFLHDKILSRVENYLFSKFPWLEKTFGKVQPTVVAKAEEIVKNEETKFLSKTETDTNK